MCVFYTDILTPFHTYTLTLNLTLMHIFTHSHTLAHGHSLSFSLSHTLTLSYAHAYSQCHSYIHRKRRIENVLADLCTYGHAHSSPIQIQTNVSQKSLKLHFNIMYADTFWFTK